VANEGALHNGSLVLRFQEVGFEVPIDEEGLRRPIQNFDEPVPKEI